MMMGDSMKQFEYLILPGLFVLISLVSVLFGYWMGRKTITDTPLIEKRFDPKDGKEPEMDEITRCLVEDELG